MNRWVKYGLWAFGGLVVLGLAVDGDKPQSAKTAPAVVQGQGWGGDPEKLAGVGNYVVLLPAVIDAAKVEAQSRQLCEGEQICSVLGWNEKANMAHTLPMLDREARAQTYSYSVNRTTGYEQVLWNCRVIKQPPEHCLATPD